ncbi:unnamed protein product [Lupinus luteus]|uniref:Uncharacterized protein n=1 Tax=Lupinus luteus TaxID=3873 RepID=A0AAV1X6U7_LUPLU
MKQGYALNSIPFLHLLPWHSFSPTPSSTSSSMHTFLLSSTHIFFMLLSLSFRFRSHRNDRKPKGNQIPKIIDSPCWILDHTSKPWSRRVL